jgi:hypothetical protein
MAAGLAAATDVAAMQLWHRLFHQALATRRHTIWLASGMLHTCTAMAGAGPPDTGATPPPRMVSSGVLPAAHNPLQPQRLHNRFGYKACRLSKPLTYPVLCTLLTSTARVTKQARPAGAQCIDNRRDLPAA